MMSLPLWGKCNIYTDHKSLKYFFTQKESRIVTIYIQSGIQPFWFIQQSGLHKKNKAKILFHNVSNMHALVYDFNFSTWSHSSFSLGFDTNAALCSIDWCICSNLYHRIRYVELIRRRKYGSEIIFQAQPRKQCTRNKRT